MCRMGTLVLSLGGKQNAIEVFRRPNLKDSENVTLSVVFLLLGVNRQEG